jgi:hypothetical protein
MENKNYNLNSKYGRRKAREQAARNYQNGSQEYRDGVDSAKAWFVIIALIIAFVIVALGGKIK